MGVDVAAGFRHWVRSWLLPVYYALLFDVYGCLGVGAEAAGMVNCLVHTAHGSGW